MSYLQRRCYCIRLYCQQKEKETIVRSRCSKASVRQATVVVLLGAAPIAATVSRRREQEPWWLAPPTADHTAVLAGDCASAANIHIVATTSWKEKCSSMATSVCNTTRMAESVAAVEKKEEGVRRWVFARVNGLSHAANLLLPWMSQGVAAWTKLCEREDDAPCLHATLVLLAGVLHKRGLGRPAGWPWLSPPIYA